VVSGHLIRLRFETNPRNSRTSCRPAVGLTTVLSLSYGFCTEIGAKLSVRIFPDLEGYEWTRAPLPAHRRWPPGRGQLERSAIFLAKIHGISGGVTSRFTRAWRVKQRVISDQL